MAPSIQNLISQRFASVHHRQLLVISGEEQWCLKQIAEIIDAVPTEQTASLSLLTCNAHLPSNIQTVSSNNTQFKQHLGSEFDFVIYNAWQGIRANALTALSGTIKKNGLLFLLCPDFSNWDTYKDPEIASRISFGNVENFKQSFFIKHLIVEITQDDKSFYLDIKGLTGSNQKLPEEMVQSAQTFRVKNLRVKNIHEQTINEELFHEQSLLIEHIKKVSTGHTKRPLVITADRGRGKTAALGIALAQLLQNRPQTILVTAPQKQSVDTLFRHATAINPDAKEHIRFKAVDDLIINMPQADMLLIDEAAGIPVEQLKRLTSQYNRIVFTTTVHGYEGSGRGFDIRFKPWLKEFRKDTKFGTLKQPIRWFEGDCLEEFWWRTLHLKPRFPATNAPPADVPGLDVATMDVTALEVNDVEINALQFTDLDVTTYDTTRLIPPMETKGELSFEALSKQRLLEDQKLLNALFTLLVEAHYQTTPDDLVALLDAPDHRLFALFSGTCEPENLLGVVTGSIEGQFADDSLSQNIISGQRRVQGHMLPQQLAYASGESTLLNYRYFRIIRIAVPAQMREMGIGSQLWRKTHDWCLSNKIDILGSSFGVTEQLLRFWSAAGFSPVLLGFHKDKATAEFNVTVIKPLVPDNEFNDSMNMLNKHLQELFTFHLSDIYQELDNQIVCRLLRYFAQDAGEKISELSAKDTELLTLFCNGNRNLELATIQLKKLLLAKINSHKLKSQQVNTQRINTYKSTDTSHNSKGNILKINSSLMEAGGYDLLIEFLLKRLPLKQLLQKHDLKGKKHFHSTIKALASELLSF